MFMLFVESQNYETGPVAPLFATIEDAAAAAASRADTVRAMTASDFVTRWRIRPDDGSPLSDVDTQTWQDLALARSFATF
jgi:hypothetical protein